MFLNGSTYGALTFCKKHITGKILILMLSKNPHGQSDMRIL